MKKLLRAGICAAVFCLYFMGVQANVPLQEEVSTAVLFLENPADEETASEICRQEREGSEEEGNQEGELPVCFWGEEANQSLTCQETGKSYPVTELLAFGSPQLILPEGEKLSLWEEGCLLDEKTFFELFGTEDAAGQIVWRREQPYMVRGTFQSARHLMIRLAKKEDGEALRAVSVKLSDTDQAAAQTEQFSLKYGLTGEWVDFTFLGALAQDLLLLLPGILCGAGVRQLFLEGKRTERIQGKAAFYLGGVLLGAWAVWTLSGYFSVPASMLPGKWSDFSFWEAFWEGQKENLLTVLQTAQGEAQLSLLGHFGVSVFGSLASAAGCGRMLK